MSASPEITRALLALGPWVVLAATFLETFFVTGLVIPALPTIMAACVLALEGHFPLWAVAAATFAGGLAGDTVGFWVGRKGGRVLLDGDGRLRRAARRQASRASTLMQGHVLLGVSGARCISFVRTLMPMTAGMSGLGYRRYLAYDVLGVAVWGTGSILVGVGTAAGWRRVRDDLGPEVAGGIVVVAVLVWAVLRVRRMRRATGGAGA